MSHKTAILLVEDNVIIRKISVLILESLNCQVDAATNATSAFEFAKKSVYDLIFMDIGLPDRDGLSVISDIRNDLTLNTDVPIIVLTAHSDQTYANQAFDVGATKIMTKPFTKETGIGLLKKYTNILFEAEAVNH